MTTTLAVFTKNRSNPAYEAARIGADRVAAALGAVVRHYVPETPDDADQQVALVEQALALRPDAFVFTPVHPTRLDASLARVLAAGIPVFGFVNRIDAVPCVTQVGSDDGALAARIAERLIERLGGDGDVVIVEGVPGAVTSRERVAAFEAAVAAHPRIRIVARCTGHYQRAPARAAFAELLASTPHVDGVLAANDVMALGVLDALDAAGRRATVVGVNAIPEAIEAIAQGRLLASADFNAMAMCALATECAIRHRRGERVPEHITLPVELADADNWRRWALPYPQRPIPSLAEVTSP